MRDEGRQKNTNTPISFIPHPSSLIPSDGGGGTRMSDWTEDNFGNDGARDYLAMLTAKLVATIREVIGDDERIEPDEDGESLLMPSIEVLALLCERYNEAPPRVKTIRQWHEKYLAAFDAGFDKMKPPPGLKAARRKIILKTFRWLESLSESYHEA